MRAKQFAEKIIGEQLMSTQELIERLGINENRLYQWRRLGYIKSSYDLKASGSPVFYTKADVKTVVLFFCLINSGLNRHIASVVVYDERVQKQIRDKRTGILVFDSEPETQRKNTRWTIEWHEVYSPEMIAKKLIKGHIVIQIDVMRQFGRYDVF